MRVPTSGGIHTHQNLSYYLIHVAATPPDPATKPLWNSSPALDSVTWDTIPAEIRKVRPLCPYVCLASMLNVPKRGIHYSNVLLQQIPRLTEFQAAVRCDLSMRSLIGLTTFRLLWVRLKRHGSPSSPPTSFTFQAFPNRRKVRVRV